MHIVDLVVVSCVLLLFDTPGWNEISEGLSRGPGPRNMFVLFNKFIKLVIRIKRPKAIEDTDRYRKIQIDTERYKKENRKI